VRAIGVILATLALLLVLAGCGQDEPPIGDEEAEWCRGHNSAVVAAAQALGINLEHESGDIDHDSWSRACRAAYDSIHD